MVLHIPHLKSQIGQVKCGMKQRQRQRDGETNLLSDWDLLKPHSEPNVTYELHIEQDIPKETKLKSPTH